MVEEVVWGRGGRGGREEGRQGGSSQFKKEKESKWKMEGIFLRFLAPGMGMITRGMNPESESSRRQNVTRSALQPAWCVRGSESRSN